MVVHGHSFRLLHLQLTEMGSGETTSFRLGPTFKSGNLWVTKVPTEVGRNEREPVPRDTTGQDKVSSVTWTRHIFHR